VAKYHPVFYSFLFPKSFYTLVANNFPMPTKSKKKNIRYRSAVTGKFVTSKYANKHKGKTVAEKY